MKSPRGRAAAVAAMAISALLVSSNTVAPADARPDSHGGDRDSSTLRHAVKIDAIERHLKEFQKIANRHGNRAAGTDGYLASAQYVERELRKAGYKPTRQYFDFVYEEVETETLAEVSPNPRDIDTRAMSYTPNTPAGGLTGTLVAPTNALGCTAADWAGVDVTGKIALVSRGTCPFSDKSKAAGAAGAIAIVMYNNAPGELSGTLGSVDPAHIPSAGVTQADGETLLGEMASGPVTVTVELQAFTETRQTFNVIAEKRDSSHHGRQGRSEDVVMLGAHLDGVVEGPGINDNGTGSSTLLEVAKQLKKIGRFDNTVRFAWWGAEESGLVGSTHYVNDLVANDPEALDKIATYLNFDMIGSPNYIIGVYDADASSYPPTAPVPPGSIETEQMFRDYFTSVDQDVVDYQFSGRSDYQAFINNGVAAGGLSTGSNGPKSVYEQSLFGGTAGISYDPNYHSAGDDISNVSLTALNIQADGVAHATAVLANSTASVEPDDSPTASYRHTATRLPEGVSRR